MVGLQQGLQQGFQQMQLQAGPPQLQQQAWQQQPMGQQQLQAGWAQQQQQAQPTQHGVPAFTRAAPGTLLPSGKYAPPANSKWTASGAPICNTCQQEGHISSACPTKAANQGLYQYVINRLPNLSNITNSIGAPNLSNLVSVISNAVTKYENSPNDKPGLTDTSVKVGSEAPASNDDRDAHESGREASPNNLVNLNNARNKTSSQSPSDRHAREGASEPRGEAQASEGPREARTEEEAEGERPNLNAPNLNHNSNHSMHPDPRPRTHPTHDTMASATTDRTLDLATTHDTIVKLDHVLECNLKSAPAEWQLDVKVHLGKQGGRVEPSPHLDWLIGVIRAITTRRSWARWEGEHRVRNCLGSAIDYRIRIRKRLGWNRWVARQIGEHKEKIVGMV